MIRHLTLTTLRLGHDHLASDIEDSFKEGRDTAYRGYHAPHSALTAHTHVQGGGGGGVKEGHHVLGEGQGEELRRATMYWERRSHARGVYSEQDTSRMGITSMKQEEEADTRIKQMKIKKWTRGTWARREIVPNKA